MTDSHSARSEPSAGGGVSRARSRPPLFRRDIWLRLVYMIVMALLYSVAEIVVAVVAAVQFFYVLFSGTPHDALTRWGGSLAVYIEQIVRFVTFGTETRPFPFDEPWPGVPPDDVDEPRTD